MASALTNADNLAGLESLAVSVGDHDLEADRQDAGQRLAALAASPHLANLKELSVTGGIDANGLAAVLRGRWTGLRTLELELQNDDRLNPLAEPDGLRELEELRLLGVQLTGAVLSTFTRSPLLKRVKHFAVRGGPIDRTTLPKLVAAVDRDRIETFVLILPPHERLREYAAELLRQWFGDRARIISG